MAHDRFWHVASVRTHGLNGRYRMHSGQRSEPALNGSVAFDPQRTLLIWPAMFVPSLSTKGGAPESVYVADPQEWRQFLEPGVSCPQVAHRILI